jgi:hypothetical protein
MLAFTFSNAQGITKSVDTMSDKVYWLADGIIAEDISDSEKMFNLKFSFDYNNIISPVIDGLSMRVLGLSCVEKVTVILLFKDKQKITLKNWNKFNCKGNVWINLNKKETEMLSTLVLDKIKITNGRNYESILHSFTDEKSTYLKQTAEFAKNNEFVVVEK